MKNSKAQFTNLLLFCYFSTKNRKKYIDIFPEYKKKKTLFYICIAQKNNSSKSAINRLFFIQSGIKLASNKNIFCVITLHVCNTKITKNGSGSLFITEFSICTTIFNVSQNFDKSNFGIAKNRNVNYTIFN